MAVVSCNQFYLAANTDTHLVRVGWEVAVAVERAKEALTTTRHTHVAARLGPNHCCCEALISRQDSMTSRAEPEHADASAHMKGLPTL